MIDVKELRVSNWLSVISESNNVFVRVQRIDEGGVVHVHYNHSHTTAEYVECNYIQLEPIPITPEILEKCGFKNQKNVFWKLQFGESYSKGAQSFSYSLISERLEFSICHGGENQDYVYLQNVGLGTFPKYLHQLQNLIFALTGQELDIKL